MYIIIEGLDGSGKSTQTRLLVKNLSRVSDQQPWIVNEPYTDIEAGRVLREYLKQGIHVKAHLGMFLALRFELQDSVVRQVLEFKNSIVSSRGFLSTLVYQQDDYPLDWLISLHTQMPVYPDAIVVLDIDPTESTERVTTRGLTREYYERVERQVEYRQRFLDLIEHPQVAELITVPENRVVIDARGEPEEVASRVWKAVKPWYSTYVSGS